MHKTENSMLAGSTWREFSLILFVVLTGIMPSRSSDAENLPRYDLRVGRVLSYSQQATGTKPDGGQSVSSRVSTRATVLRANADGSLRVVLRSSFSHDGSPDEVTLGAFDIFPDGRASRVGPFNSEVSASAIFPPLPSKAAFARGKWTSPRDWDGVIATYRTAASTDPNKFVFTSTADGPLWRVYELAIHTTQQFDRRKGILVQTDDELTQDYGEKQTLRGKQVLVKDELIEPARLPRLAMDYDKLFEADARCVDLLMRMSDEPANSAKLAAQAMELLAAARKTVEDPEVAREFDRIRKHREQDSKDDIESASRALALLGKPIADWNVKDLDGKSWSGTELKGHVVIMDFWYRGCPWCMYAMPAINQLAADYKNRGVIVLGMNTDPKESDAKFVVKALGLEYPQLQAAQLRKRLDIENFPTFIIIDQQGTIRATYSGYSPRLHDWVARRLDAMLDKQHN
jgi:thiol-disulfide isomerase/thioredoxin